MAFAEFYGQESNNVAEAKAIHTRIQWCNWNNYIHSIIESDSLIIVNMIKTEVNLSWKLKDIIQQIWDSNISGNFKFQHCLREGNMVADFLAIWGEKNGKSIFFTQAVSLPSKVRALMKNDQIGLPCLRIRHIKG